MSYTSKYCPSLTSYSRLKTREIKVGNVGFGGCNPIRVQSMTTVDTMDTNASVEQAIRMIDAGCELVRYTAPSKKEAENLKEIKSALLKKGYDTPLVADIHFTPNAAELAAQYVEKIRVNPGNYADKKKFEAHEYTDNSYRAELERIREKLTPLVLLCKDKGRAMRIGTNHGSLSDRIMSRYGDTPLGMVESALEFVQICEDLDYYDIIISMKASNPLIMVHAYRLLTAKMLEKGIVYPLHLGVTEAGEGEDGRIKSAVGIGALLEDGLGDTIRVSLTEEPEYEIPVAKKLVERYNKIEEEDISPIKFELPYNPYAYSRRFTKNISDIGGNNVPVVIADLSQIQGLQSSHLFACGYSYNRKDDKWHVKDQAADYIYTGGGLPNFELPVNLKVICSSDIWQNQNNTFPIFNSISEFEEAENKSSVLNFLHINAREAINIKRLTNVFADKSVVLVLHSDSPHKTRVFRRFFIELLDQKIDVPVILSGNYTNLDDASFQLYCATDFGGLLLDGMGDGVFIQTKNCSNPAFNNSTAFGILQATRTRISKTEYISCPSCGRTLFDLQETTAKIRSKTAHLKGLKIGIMGCVVNGPGEMADADYGYVGVGKGKINLYKEKEVVKRNIKEEDALEELIALIKSHGDWVDV